MDNWASHILFLGNLALRLRTVSIPLLNILTGIICTRESYGAVYSAMCTRKLRIELKEREKRSIHTGADIWPNCTWKRDRQTWLLMALEFLASSLQVAQPVFWVHDLSLSLSWHIIDLRFLVVCWRCVLWCWPPEPVGQLESPGWLPPATAASSVSPGCCINIIICICARIWKRLKCTITYS